MYSFGIRTQSHSPADVLSFVSVSYVTPPCFDFWTSTSHKDTTFQHKPMYSQRSKLPARPCVCSQIEGSPGAAGSTFIGLQFFFFCPFSLPVCQSASSHNPCDSNQSESKSSQVVIVYYSTYGEYITRLSLLIANV